MIFGKRISPYLVYIDWRYGEPAIPINIEGLLTSYPYLSLIISKKGAEPTGVIAEQENLIVPNQINEVITANKHLLHAGFKKRANFAVRKRGRCQKVSERPILIDHRS
jgi:hypothetical protein